MSFYFLTEFFKYFFRVLHEASSSWLKLCCIILGHPVSLIYGDRTIIGFVGLVVNLLNRPIDGATVGNRKRVTFRPFVSM
jgi:hypothetical protein